MAVGMSEHGSLHAGLGEWVIQRLTAVYMLLFIVIAFLRLSILPISSQADWLLLSSSLFFQVTFLLFIFSMLAHAWLGLKSVLLDYIHPWRLRFLLLMIVALMFLGTGIWAMLVVMLK